MFEKIKLDLYRKRLKGFAYDFSPRYIMGVPCAIDCNIYMIINNNNENKFINFSSFTVATQDEVNSLYQCFDKYDFICRGISEISYENTPVIGDKERKNVLKLVKSIPRERKDF